MEYYSSVADKKKKRLLRNKKFYILICCYILVFAITMGITLAWFGGDDWSTSTLYMGGPIYLHVADNERITSGEGQLNVQIPQEKLYPGMNMQFQVRAHIVGRTWVRKLADGDKVTMTNTPCVLRARLLMTVSGLTETNNEALKSSLFSDLFDAVIDDSSSNTNIGSWYYDTTDDYFYYMERRADKNYTADSSMQLNGGTGADVYVDFLNNVLVQLQGQPFDNEYADASVGFTVVIQAVQGVFFWQRGEEGATPDNIGKEKTDHKLKDAKMYFADCFAQ